ncbi:MAG: gamma-glutamylcyclotransferase family protein [Bacteroidota bacterium]
MNRLFVYGTLAPGRPNEHVLKPLGGSWVKAYVKGKLFEKGWGAALGYPAIVLDDDGEEVEGLIFTSDKLETYWEELDDFEGEAYERKLVLAELENGDEFDTYIYALRQ